MKKLIVLSVAMLFVAGLSIGVVSANSEQQKEQPKTEVKAEKSVAKPEKKMHKAAKKENSTEVKKEEVKK